MPESKVGGHDCRACLVGDSLFLAGLRFIFTRSTHVAQSLIITALNAWMVHLMTTVMCGRQRRHEIPSAILRFSLKSLSVRIACYTFHQA